ncbi:hypothetical protein SAMN05444280_11292 [Tangfeifania diversioriginum]|uniref:Uncharacterized protein n=1 Tax=Tangfeifania diversioriginum TaxID=1168035 RepID=A0A1M6H5J2_9BACT|nr:DUF6364 family protein [Tangfeifania diversioriginum]SHJ17455.1 hypothetical protein SAMN05444280_11292 [Tangfeifania diversioriginum]
MDTKVTLQFDKKIIEKAKMVASDNTISLSRLTEFLYRDITSENYKTLKEFPINKWVNQIARGEAIYKRRNRIDTKNDFFNQTKLI